MRSMDSERAEVISMKIQSFITEKFENERIKVNKLKLYKVIKMKMKKIK